MTPLPLGSTGCSCCAAVCLGKLSTRGICSTPIDQARYRIDGLRDDLLDMHRMAPQVINQDDGDSPRRRSRSGNWRRCLRSEMLEVAAGLGEAWRARPAKMAARKRGEE